jgi:hypothetical protein
VAENLIGRCCIAHAPRQSAHLIVVCPCVVSATAGAVAPDLWTWLGLV